MSEELKPCPFCGSDKVTVSRTPHSKYGILYGIGCKSCNAHGSFRFIFEHYAIISWNTRPAEESLKAEVGRLRRALESIAENAEFWDDEDDSLAVIYRICKRALRDNPPTGKEGEDE